MLNWFQSRQHPNKWQVKTSERTFSGFRPTVRSGRLVLGHPLRCTTAPLKNLPQGHRNDQCLLWAPSNHSPVNEAALKVAYHLNDGKLRDTGHSSEPAPPAAMAELLALASRQVSVRQTVAQMAPLLNRLPSAAIYHPFPQFLPGLEGGNPFCRYRY